MLRNFFAATNFLGLLRFWDRSRAGNGMSDWNGEVSSIPPELLSRLIIGERDTEIRYRYVGEYNVRQFGRDPTGSSVTETLNPEYAAYVADIVAMTLDRGAPVFSASVLNHDGKTKLSGRLMTPFTLRGAACPSITLSAHLAGGDDFKVTEIVAPGSVVETQRLMIADVPEICERLEEAWRYQRFSRMTHDRLLAAEWDKIAATLGAGVVVPLENFRAAPA